MQVKGVGEESPSLQPRLPPTLSFPSHILVIPAKAGIYTPAPAESSATLSKRTSDASPQRPAYPSHP